MEDMLILTNFRGKEGSNLDLLANYFNQFSPLPFLLKPDPPLKFSKIIATTLPPSSELSSSSDSLPQLDSLEERINTSDKRKSLKDVKSRQRSSTSNFSNKSLQPSKSPRLIKKNWREKMGELYQTFKIHQIIPLNPSLTFQEYKKGFQILNKKKKIESFSLPDPSQLASWEEAFKFVFFKTYNPKKESQTKKKVNSAISSWMGSSSEDKPKIKKKSAIPQKSSQPNSTQTRSSLDQEDNKEDDNSE